MSEYARSQGTADAARVPAGIPGGTSNSNRNQGSWKDLVQVLAIRGRDQRLFAFCSLIAFVALTGYCGRVGHWGAQAIELERQAGQQLSYRIELNAATWVEWSQLPGIGPVLGKRIVEEREQNGAFRGVNDLTRVKGIGGKRLLAIQPFIRAGGFADPTPARGVSP